MTAVVARLDLYVEAQDLLLGMGLTPSPDLVLAVAMFAQLHYHRGAGDALADARRHLMTDMEHPVQREGGPNGS